MYENLNNFSTEMVFNKAINGNMDARDFRLFERALLTKGAQGNELKVIQALSLNNPESKHQLISGLVGMDPEVLQKDKLATKILKAEAREALGKKSENIKLDEALVKTLASFPEEEINQEKISQIISHIYFPIIIENNPYEKGADISNFTSDNFDASYGMTTDEIKEHYIHESKREEEYEANIQSLLSKAIDNYTSPAAVELLLQQRAEFIDSSLTRSKTTSNNTAPDASALLLEYRIPKEVKDPLEEAAANYVNTILVPSIDTFIKSTSKSNTKTQSTSPSMMSTQEDSRVSTLIDNVVNGLQQAGIREEGLEDEGVKGLKNSLREILHHDDNLFRDIGLKDKLLYKLANGLEKFNNNEFTHKIAHYCRKKISLSSKKIVESKQEAKLGIIEAAGANLREGDDTLGSKVKDYITKQYIKSTNFSEEKSPGSPISYSIAQKPNKVNDKAKGGARLH